jgi:beta-glucosidase
VSPQVVRARRSRAVPRAHTGSRTGTEVAQVYLSLPRWTGEPPKRLVGWERVTLARGKLSAGRSAGDIEDTDLVLLSDAA